MSDISILKPLEIKFIELSTRLELNPSDEINILMKNWINEKTVLLKSQNSSSNEYRFPVRVPATPYVIEYSIGRSRILNSNVTPEDVLNEIGKGNLSQKMAAEKFGIPIKAVKNAMSYMHNLPHRLAEDDEVFKRTLENPNRYISNHGRLFNSNTRQLCTVTIKQGRGYLYANLSKGKDNCCKEIHSLVASSFLPARPAYHIKIDHIDSNKYNNRVDNLRYVTDSENQKNSWLSNTRRSQL